MIIIIIALFLRAVEVLKMCAATGDISFLIARDKRSLDEFHRLSQKFAKQELGSSASESLVVDYYYCY